MDYTKKLSVKPGRKVKLSKIDSSATPGVADKKEARSIIAKNVKRLGELQYLLSAAGKRSLLIVLQALDAGGKDGTIKHVMGPLNPQGVRVASFKVPTPEELGHDFLWRIHKATPRRGEIVIFNRSHYEDVLVVRVHGLAPESVWSKRYEQINAFEKTLAADDTHVLKFYLHISRNEQLARFKKRIDDPRRHWKLSHADFEERKLWDRYVAAYEDALAKCSTPHAPWFVIPSDHKWFRNLAVSQIIVETLERLKMKFPKPSIDVSKIVLK